MSQRPPLNNLDSFKPAAAWRGPWRGHMDGDLPRLELTEKTSLQILSGRNGDRVQWDKTITIAYRTGEFLMAGYAYESNDAHDESNDTKVDYNVLSGEITVSGKTSQVPGKSIPWNDWSEKDLPKEVPAIGI